MKKEKENNQLVKLRHSASHIMTAAVEMIYGKEIGLGVGPWTDTGFYQDYDLGYAEISDKDLKKIEKKMRWIINKDMPIKKEIVDADTARKLHKDDPYKTELIDELDKKGEEISVYYIGESLDKALSAQLCEGPHLSSTGELKIFKLEKLAGAYWRGDEKNKMLTRIYGLAFENEDDLQKYEELQEEARKRDHRKLGKELDLFFTSDDVGKGLPLWTPKGAFIRKKLEDYMYDKEYKAGYEYIYTPILTKESLYEQSGHLAHYSDDMYNPMDIDGENYYLRPMNCPHHHQVFNRKPVSYKELPIRLAEFGNVHRFERSGVLTGLIRTRGFTQNDSHIYCAKSQLKTELLSVLKMFDEVYSDFNITDYWYRLSLPDFDNTEKYGDLDDKEMWEESTRLTREALQEYGAQFTEEGGEAAFYGPKIDVQIKNVLGKEDTIATVQVDFYSTKKFNIQFTNKNGEKEPVVIIHRAIMGSFERFFAFLLEQTAGHFPLWLSPEQVRIIPIANSHEPYAQEVYDACISAGIRTQLDVSHDTFIKKIRNAKTQKIPYLAIVGDKEMHDGTVSLESRDKSDAGTMQVDAFIEKVAQQDV